MTNDIARRAGRIALRLKLIVACLVLVGLSLLIVGAFAAGFVTGTLVATSDQKDLCDATGGTWDGDASLCINPQATVQQQESLPASGASTYFCGDDTRFLVYPAVGNAIRYQDASTTSRELVNADPDGNIAIYSDDSLSVTLVGPEARLEDSATGRSVSCVLR